MFQGFSVATINFLKDLTVNNNKVWFEANKADYKQYLLEPMQALVTDLGPFMLSIDPLFEINPRKAISRINRDLRFSHDKSPYRTNMWLSFKRIYLDWKTEPTYFFEIFPDFYRYGMGFYNMPREAMNKLREMIVQQDARFKKIHSLYKKQDTFGIEGEKYKKILNKDLPEALNEWYQMKEIYFICNKNIDMECGLFSSELLNELMDGFRLLEPFYKFFLTLRGNLPPGK